MFRTNRWIRSTIVSARRLLSYVVSRS